GKNLMNSSPHSANAGRHSPSGESTFGRAKRRVSLFFLVLSLGAWSGNVYAQTSFYQGKTIRVIVGSSAGGGYDLWARLTGLYLGKYIPAIPPSWFKTCPGRAERWLRTTSMALRNPTV